MVDILFFSSFTNDLVNGEIHFLTINSSQSDTSKIRVHWNICPILLEATWLLPLQSCDKRNSRITSTKSHSLFLLVNFGLRGVQCFL